MLSATESFPRLVTLLSTHINYLSKLETKHNESIQLKMKVDTNKLNINEFLTIDTEIRNEFESNTEKIQKKINDLTSGSTLELQKKLELDKKEIDLQQLKVKKEIEELEHIIKRTKNLLLHSTKASSDAIITTESKYKKFMTGEERRQIEAKIKKKQEKSKEAILEHNENLKQKDINDQIENLKGQINTNSEFKKIQEELNKLNEKKTELEKK